jgi:glycosyltransferase involved in cell wall biosynthesis
MNTFNQQKSLSIIIPAYNEHESIHELVNRIYEHVKKLAYNVEVILVSDGSTDSTYERFIDCCKELRLNYKAIKMYVNRGKATALQHGIDAAKGDLIITMDADLQDQPEHIADFIKQIEQGFDVVSGWKKKRFDSKIKKNLPSKVFNFINRKVLKSDLNDINCGFKCYRSEVFKVVELYGDFHRFIPVLAAQNGFVVGEIEVVHASRKHGESKYGVSRFIRGTFDILTLYYLDKFSHRPLHFFGFVGLFLGFCSFIGFITLVPDFLSGQAIGSRPLFLLSIMSMLIGVQFVLMGVLAQHLESRSRRAVRACKIKIVSSE